MSIDNRVMCRFFLKLLTVLIACAVTGSEAGLFGRSSRFQARDKKTSDMSREDLRLHDAKAAYEDLFDRPGKYSTNEILDRLKAVENVDALECRSGFNISKLVHYDDTSEEKCDDFHLMKDMRLDYDKVLATRNYGSLKPYMKDVFRRQLDVCDFVNRFRQRLDAFKQQDRDRWSLISNLMSYANNIEKRQTKYKDTTSHSKIIELLIGMARNDYQNLKQSENIYKLAVNVSEACTGLSKLDNDLALIELDPEWKKMSKSEVHDWQRLMSTCKQAKDANYEQLIGDSFGYAYISEMQDAWKVYQDWSASLLL